MKILVTLRHLLPINMKEKRKLVTDMVILKLFTRYGECERFSAKKWPNKFTKLQKLFLKTLSKIREYAGPRTINSELVRVCCMHIH